MQQSNNPKKQKRDEKIGVFRSNNNSIKKQKVALSFPFVADYNDHFETPLVAYEDLEPILSNLALKLQKKNNDLIIYDPYYCQGRMKELLASIGFTNVVNNNRDFYKDIKCKNVPTYDILVTNPPYSGEHKTKLLQYLKTTNKPFALLLPVYTATKSYWRDVVTASKIPPLYLLPPKSYEYDHPEGTGKDLPPFYSCWFLSYFEKEIVLNCKKKHCKVVDSVDMLIKDGYCTDKRPNPRQRKKMKEKLQLVAQK